VWLSFGSPGEAHGGTEILMGKRKKPDILLTMRGIITPSEWDEENHVTGITLSTVEEEEYRIHQDNTGRQLFRLLQKEVAVSGVVGLDAQGNRLITVKAYDVREFPKS